MARKSRARRRTNTPVPADVQMSDLDLKIEALGQQKVRVQQGGRSVEMSTTDVVLKKLVATAVAGGSHALSQYFDLIQGSEEVRQAVVSQEVEIGLRLKASHKAIYARHRDAHGVDPAVYPHPDDIVIDRRRGYKIIGPSDEIGQRTMERVRAEIEALLLQDALDRARATPSRRRDPTIEKGDGVFLAMVLNETLPPRLQRSSTDFISTQMSLARRAQRELLKQTRAAWAQAGHEVPRGARPISAETGAAMFELLSDAARICSEGLSEAESERRVADAVVRRFG